MVSSRRLPTSYNVSTYGTASRDYSALDTWEAATDNDLVTATKGEVLECYDDASTFNDGIDLAGATTNSDYFRVIKPAAGEGHDGTPNNGVNFTFMWDSFAAIALTEDYSQVHDIIVTNTNTGSSAVGFLTLNPNNVIAGCIAHGITSAATINAGFWAETGMFINCLAIDIANSSYPIGYLINSAGSNIFYNCNCIDTSAYGFYCSDGNTGIAKNCISENNTTNWYEEGTGTWTKTACTDDNGVVFKDAINDDYHLATSDTAARNQGTDLSSIFDDDIDGETRSAWDIGADEYSVSGWAGKVLGVTGIAKINGIAVADIAKVMGV